MIFWKKNWWALTFLVFLSLFYFHFYNQKKLAVSQLTLRLQKIEEEKSLALNIQQELSLKLSSQEDPAWIELILMRDLGVVPEGFLKVHFQK